MIYSNVIMYWPFSTFRIVLFLSKHHTLFHSDAARINEMEVTNDVFKFKNHFLNQRIMYKMNWYCSCLYPEIYIICSFFPVKNFVSQMIQKVMHRVYSGYPPLHFYPFEKSTHFSILHNPSPKSTYPARQMIEFDSNPKILSPLLILFLVLYYIVS